MTSVFSGMAKGALNEFAKLMKVSMSSPVRPPVLPWREHPDYQRWYGTAAGKLALADAGLEGLSREWTALAERGLAGGAPFSAEDDLRIIAASYEINKLAWDAVSESIWPYVGTTQARDGSVMQRIYRDMSTARTHLTNVVADGLRRDLAPAALG